MVLRIVGIKNGLVLGADTLVDSRNQTSKHLFWVIIGVLYIGEDSEDEVTIFLWK